jgi:hypothetical protein
MVQLANARHHPSPKFASREERSQISTLPQGEGRACARFDILGRRSTIARHDNCWECFSVSGRYLKNQNLAQTRIRTVASV